MRSRGLALQIRGFYRCIPGATLFFFVSAMMILFSTALSMAESDSGKSEPALSASFDRDSAKLGSTVTLTLTYRLPQGARLSAKPQIKGLEDLTIVETRIEPEQIKILLLVDKLEALKTGPLILPYLDKEGNAHSLQADAVKINTLSNLGDKPEEAQLKPIQDIIPTTSPLFKYWPWLAGLLGLALIMVLVWWYLSQRAKKLSAEVMEPPHLIAAKGMKELQAGGLYERGKVKEFYFRFSEILRRYLEAIRGFPAAEFTTQEIALAVHEEVDRRLLSLLRRADLVKFADRVPSPERKNEDMKRAFSYIEETSPASENDHLPRGVDG
jgi:hypothetical protein